MAYDNRRVRTRSEYVYGNAARELAPERRERVYENGRRVQSSTRELRERDKALQMNGAYVFFLAAVSVFCLAMCVVYLGIQSEITSTRENITTLKNDIHTVTSKNEAVNYAIDGYVSAERIIKIAKKDLGMVDAESDQVVFYKSTDSEYTVQYKDIPKE